MSPPCCLMRAVHILCHMMTRVVDRAVQAEGLTAPRWVLMMAVQECGETLTITQLSERLCLSPQNVSRMVASLEADGLVTRDTSGPGRTVRVGLTPTGVERVGACASLAAGMGARMLEGVSASELEQATAVLERAIRNTVELERTLARPGQEQSDCSEENRT